MPVSLGGGQAVSGGRTVTVRTRDHGPVTLTCPAWCRTDHTAGPVEYRADVTHRGPDLSLALPGRRGPDEWLYVCVDQAPLSAYDPALGVVVEVGGVSVRYAPEGLRALADVLAAQLAEVRAFADRVERLVSDSGVSS